MKESQNAQHYWVCVVLQLFIWVAAPQQEMAVLHG